MTNYVFAESGPRLRAEGRLDLALQHCQRDVDNCRTLIARRRADSTGAVPAYDVVLCHGLVELGQVHMARHAVQEALACYDEATALAAKRLSARREEEETRHYHARTALRAAQALEEQDPGAAERRLEAIAQLESRRNAWNDAHFVAAEMVIADATNQVALLLHQRGESLAALRRVDACLRRVQELIDNAGSDDRRSRLLFRVLHNQSAIAQQSGDLETARAAVERELELARKMTAGGPQDTGWNEMLAGAYLQRAAIDRSRGDMQGFLDNQLRCRQVLRDMRDSMIPMSPFHQELLADLEKVVVENPGDLKIVATIDPAQIARDTERANALAEAAAELESSGKHAEALASFREYLALAESLLLRNASDPGWQRNVVAARQKVGDLSLRQGDQASARAAYAAAVELARAQHVAHPEVELWTQGLYTGLAKLADQERALGRPGEALEFDREAHELVSALAQAHPGDQGAQSTLAISHGRLGRQLMQLGNTEEGLAHLRAVVECESRAAAQTPGGLQRSIDLHAANSQLADALAQCERWQEALAARSEAARATDRLLNADPHAALHLQHHATAHWNLGLAQQKVGDPAASLKSWLECLASLEALSGRDRAVSAQWAEPAAYIRAELARSGAASTGRADAGAILPGALLGWTECSQVATGSASLESWQPENGYRAVVVLIAGGPGPFRIAFDAAEHPLRLDDGSETTPIGALTSIDHDYRGLIGQRTGLFLSTESIRLVQGSGTCWGYAYCFDAKRKPAAVRHGGAWITTLERLPNPGAMGPGAPGALNITAESRISLRGHVPCCDRASALDGFTVLRAASDGTGIRAFGIVEGLVLIVVRVPARQLGIDAITPADIRLELGDGSVHPAKGIVVSLPHENVMRQGLLGAGTVTRDSMSLAPGGTITLFNDFQGPFTGFSELDCKVVAAFELRGGGTLASVTIGKYTARLNASA